MALRMGGQQPIVRAAAVTAAGGVAWRGGVGGGVGEIVRRDGVVENGGTTLQGEGDGGDGGRGVGAGGEGGGGEDDAATAAAAVMWENDVEDNDGMDDDDGGDDDDDDDAAADATAVLPAAARRRRRLGIDGGVPSGGAVGNLYGARRLQVSQCMDRITVQLFGSTPIVAFAVLRENMLEVLINVLADTLLPASLSSLPRGALDPSSEGIRARLYMRPCNDLRMCLTHRGAAQHWLAKPELLRTVLAVLRSMQGMNPYVLKTGDHVEREGNDWINAMTAELFVMTTFRIGAASVADGLSGKSMVKKGAGAGGGGGGGAGVDAGTAAAVAAVEAERAQRATAATYIATTTR